ncbi:hypothetical protein D9756_002546 [Leucocoprinus leucothites]|uniref:Uncharacterized protein n=1 Tax=Leucocoprinus leucothites TaxID=201217 RepID=A0A8H5LMD9_9AGAR|nr:hypothetical protein D9756_002546 [Leucoagaricus leucothites]
MQVKLLVSNILLALAVSSSAAVIDLRPEGVVRFIESSLTFTDTNTCAEEWKPCTSPYACCGKLRCRPFPAGAFCAY